MRVRDIEASVAGCVMNLTLVLGRLTLILAMGVSATEVHDPATTRATDTSYSNVSTAHAILRVGTNCEWPRVESSRNWSIAPVEVIRFFGRYAKNVATIVHYTSGASRTCRTDISEPAAAALVQRLGATIATSITRSDA